MTENSPVQFCEGCPFVPSGVVAEVTEIELMTPGEIRRYQSTGQIKDFPGPIEGSTARVIATAVRSSSPAAEVGDEAELFVVSNGNSSNDIKEAIRNCPNPTKVGRLAKALGSKGLCQAMQIR
jgi:hypothetical protein